jgi:protein associated with RNAse G/E
LLDVDEYEVNKIEMNYPEKIQEKIIETKEKIMQLIKEGYFINHFAKYINELKEEEKGSNGN